MKIIYKVKEVCTKDMVLTYLKMKGCEFRFHHPGHKDVDNEISYEVWENCSNEERICITPNLVHYGRDDFQEVSYKEGWDRMKEFLDRVLKLN